VASPISKTAPLTAPPNFHPGRRKNRSFLEHGTSRLRQTGDRLNLLMLLRLHANACLDNHLLSQALEIIDEALALSQETLDRLLVGSDWFTYNA